MDQIQVNIHLLLLLVAVKSKRSLWREEFVCGCGACSQPCAVSTGLTAAPEVIACSSGALCRPLPHFTISAFLKVKRAIHSASQDLMQSVG